MTSRALVLAFTVSLALLGCGSGPPRNACDSSTCPSGCCDASGTCQAGFMPEACGSSGLACMACNAGTTCQLGFCVPTNTSGGGAGGGGGHSGGGAGGGGGSACVPKTCAELAPACGVVSNGCTGTVDCGPCNARLVVSQVYGGGGNAGATYTNDFIELFNAGPVSISLAGWSVQYAAATSATWQVTPLTGSIGPGRRFLIAQAAGSGGTTALPSAEVTGVIALGASSGKVALVRGTAALAGNCPTSSDVVDLVGYGTADCREGNAAPAPSATLAILRSNGCSDTNDNAADFTLASPTPRNSSVSPQTCP